MAEPTFEQIRDGIANAIEDWPHDEYWPPTIAERVRAIGPTPTTPSAESAPLTNAPRSITEPIFKPEPWKDNGYNTRPATPPSASATIPEARVIEECIKLCELVLETVVVPAPTYRKSLWGRISNQDEIDYAQFRREPLKTAIAQLKEKLAREATGGKP